MEEKKVKTCRAKFTVTNVTDTPDGAAISLNAVYDSNPDSENGKFFKYTPSGSISLQIVNPTAAEVFKVNQEVYVDFTPVSG